MQGRRRLESSLLPELALTRDQRIPVSPVMSSSRPTRPWRPGGILRPGLPPVPLAPAQVHSVQYLSCYVIPPAARSLARFLPPHPGVAAVPSSSPRASSGRCGDNKCDMTGRLPLFSSSAFPDLPDRSGPSPSSPPADGRKVLCLLSIHTCALRTCVGRLGRLAGEQGAPVVLRWCGRTKSPSSMDAS